MKALFITCLLILTGCTSLGITEQKTVHVDKSKKSDKGLEIASFPAQLRGAYVYTDENGKKHVCAEPFTDVAASSSLNATANAVNNLSTALNQSINASRNSTGSLNNQSDRDSSSEGEGGSQSSSSGAASERNRSHQNSLGSSNEASAQAEQSINVGLNAVNQIVALEGRTQFVLLAREMLYRTCEAAANGHLDSDQTIVAKQHELIFSALTKMIDTQKAKAEAEKVKAETAKFDAAKKLDPSILKVLENGGLDQVMQDQFLDEYTACLGEAGDDQEKKSKCKETYKKQVSRLQGK